MPLIDTHCHLNFDRYAADRAAVIARAAAAGVPRIIIPAIDLPSCQQALALAAAHDGIFAAVGIHPNSTAAFDGRAVTRLREWAAGRKVIAIGEIGLDYYWDKSPKAAQQRALEAQLELARELELPVIIHNREASADLLAILAAWLPSLSAAHQQRPGVLHSFSAAPEIAERALTLGFYLGFTGPLTFKKADALRAVAQSTPRHRLLIETDGPFLTPHPHRGKRNEPAYLPHINRRLAELHSLPPAAMADCTTANAERLFALP